MPALENVRRVVFRISCNAICWLMRVPGRLANEVYGKQMDNSFRFRRVNSAVSNWAGMRPQRARKYVNFDLIHLLPLRVPAVGQLMG